MKNIGGLLVFFGIGSIVLHFLGMEFRLLSWIDNWGETVGWGIKGGMVRPQELVEIAAAWLPQKLDVIDGAQSSTLATACSDIYETANPAGTVLTQITRLDTAQPLAEISSSAAVVSSLERGT